VLPYSRLRPVLPVPCRLDLGRDRLQGGTWPEGDREYAFDPLSCTLAYTFPGGSPCGAVGGSFTLRDGAGAGQGEFVCWDFSTGACLCRSGWAPGSCTATQEVY